MRIPRFVTAYLGEQPLLLALMALGHLIADMHAGGLPVLLPPLKEAYNLSYAQVGTLVLLSQVSSSIVQPLFGLASDRLPARWLLPASLAVAFGGLAVVALAWGYAAVVFGVVLMGLGIAAYHPEGSKVAHFVAGEQKGSALAIFALGGNIGLALGPLVMAAGLAVAGVKGALIFALPTLAAIALLQAALPALNRVGEGAARPPRAGRGAAAAPAPLPPPGRGRAVAILLGAITLRSCAHTALLTFIPLYYGEHLALGAAYSSLLLTTFLVAGAVGTLAGGPASDRWGARRVIVFSFLAAAPLLVALPFFTGGIAPFVIAALGGFTLVSSFAVTTVLGQELMPDQVGLASGLTLGFSVGTGGLGVTLLGYVADVLGLGAAMLVLPLLAALGFALSLLLPQAPSEAARAARTGQLPA